MEAIEIPVPADASRSFTDIAQGIRLVWRSFGGGPAPSSGSDLLRADTHSPHDLVSRRARNYTIAALDHLVFWADFAAPLKFHPEQRTTFTLRPSLTLARAALESSSQGAWLLSSTSMRETIRRHISLIRWDLDEHRKSSSGEAKEELQAGLQACRTGFGRVPR